MTTCFDIVSRDVTDISQEEVDELLAELQKRQRSMVAGGMPPDEANAKASKSVQDDLKRAAAHEKRAAAINLRVRRAELDAIETSFPDNYKEGLEALLVGSKFWKDNARYGVDQVQNALRRKYEGGFIGDLDRAKLMKHYSDGELDLEIATALRDLDDPSKLAGLPSDAIEIAKILRKWQEVARTDANKSGANIGKLSDYIVAQSHDANRLQRMGFDKWFELIAPRLDLERMLPNATPQDVRSVLQEAYTGLVTGIHEDIGGVEKMAAFKGPGNLAKKMSQQRSLHFKSAKDWMEYNEIAGVGNLREAVHMGFGRMAEATGLMRKLGTNPEANLASIVDTLRQKARDSGDIKQGRELDEWMDRGKGLYSIVSGKSRAAVNDSMALAFGVTRGVQSITKLGGAVLSAVSDPFIAGNSARHEGRNMFATIGEQLLSPFKAALEAMSPGNRAAALREMDYATDGVIGGMASRFSQQEAVPGAMAWLMRKTFGLNLLRPHTDVQRGAAILGTSGHLASLAEMKFADIDPQTQRMLANYGITAKMWPLMKDAVKAHGDFSVLSPQGIRDMDSRAFAVLAKDRVNQVKADTAERIVKRMKQDQKEHDWVKGRAAKLREKMDQALTKLNERHKNAEGRSKEIIKSLRQRLSSLDEKIDHAEGWWQHRVDPNQKVDLLGKSSLRKTGLTEGKALESQKALRSEVKQLAHDLEKFKKETGEDFISKWSDRQEEFTAFADGVDQRIQERADATNRELVNLDPVIERILDETREDMATRLQTLVYDRMNHAVISPTARTDYISTGGGLQRGTWLGESVRSMMQFKSFSIAFWQNAIQQEMYSRGATRWQAAGYREWLGMAQLMATLTVAGYMSMTLKNWAKGKTARPIDDPHTWMASAVQGGGAGLYGDFLFGEKSRFGSSALEQLAGPTLSDAAEIIDIAQSLRDLPSDSSDLQDAGAKSLKFGVNHTPFINLFYTKLAMEHMFLYQLQENLNPGYLRRMERRVERDTGAEWNIRPTEAIH